MRKTNTGARLFSYEGGLWTLATGRGVGPDSLCAFDMGYIFDWMVRFSDPLDGIKLAIPGVVSGREGGACAACRTTGVARVLGMPSGWR